MGLLRSVFNATVGTVVRAPVAAVKVVDELIDPESEDIGDTLDYLTSGKSDNADYDGVADFDKDED